MLIKPDYNLKNIFEINTEELKNMGIKAILLDLDSTIMVSHSGVYSEEVTEWLKNLEKDFVISIISNQKNQKYIDKVKKVTWFNMIFGANKPNPKVIKEFLKEKGLKTSEAVMVGDRPLTDVVAGKLAGCKTILVGSINPKENLPTRFVRALERSVIRN